MLSIVIGFASNHFCFVMRRLTNTVQLVCLYIGQSLFVRGSERWKVSENLATLRHAAPRLRESGPSTGGGAHSDCLGVKE